jgi:hypothetical protein
VHALGEGTDSGQAWFLAMTAIVVLPAVLLLVIRHCPPRRRLDARAQQAATAAAR